MVKKQGRSCQVRLAPEQIAAIDAVLGRVSAVAVGEEANKRYALALARAECRRVAALIKESRSKVVRRILRLRGVAADDIELMKDLARYHCKSPADLLRLMVHRELAEVAGGSIVSLHDVRLSGDVISAYKRVFAKLMPAKDSVSVGRRRNANR